MYVVLQFLAPETPTYQVRMAHGSFRVRGSGESFKLLLSKLWKKNQMKVQEGYQVRAGTRGWR